MKRNGVLSSFHFNVFSKENQWSFKYGSIEEFGLRNNQFEEEGEIISRRMIEESIDKGEAYGDSK